MQLKGGVWVSCSMLDWLLLNVKGEGGCAEFGLESGVPLHRCLALCRLFIPRFWSKQCAPRQGDSQRRSKTLRWKSEQSGVKVAQNNDTERSAVWTSLVEETRESGGFWSRGRCLWPLKKTGQCVKAEKAGGGGRSSLVSGLGVFLSRPVEPECLLSVDKIWGREELSNSFPLSLYSYSTAWLKYRDMHCASTGQTVHHEGHGVSPDWPHRKRDPVSQVS